MASRPRDLTTLPSDVLREILGFVLDGPNGPLRAAVLSTHSLLHELGTPLLFKHVRLATFTSWKSMFIVGGVLSPIEDGGMGMGRYVKELELDRLDEQDADWYFPVSPSLQLPSVHTLTLSHHLVETWTLHPSAPFDTTDGHGPTSSFMRHIPPSLFSSIFTHLPAIHTLRYLVASKAPFPNPPSSGRHKHHTRQAISTLLGLTQPYEHRYSDKSPAPSTPFPFPLLRTIVYVGGLVLDNCRGNESIASSATAFAMLPMVETLVIEFHKDESSILKSDLVYKALIFGSLAEERETRWKGLKSWRSGGEGRLRSWWKVG